MSSALLYFQYIANLKESIDLGERDTVSESVHWYNIINSIEAEVCPSDHHITFFFYFFF